MKTYLSIIRYAMTGWLLYIICWLFSEKLFGTNIISKICEKYYFYIFAFCLFLILPSCYKHNISYRKTFFITFLFSYWWFGFVHLLFIYSESHIIRYSSDVLIAILSLLLDPLWQGLIAALLATFLYAVVIKLIKMKMPVTYTGTDQ